MTITELLNKIKSAVYGSEVRLAIHDAIKKAYDDAAEAGNANMEVELARGTEPTLNDRLGKMDDKDQEVTAQLAQKATKIELNSLGQLKLSGTYATLTDLHNAYPTGSEGLYLVISDGYTYRFNGSAWVQVIQFQATEIGDNSIDSRNLKGGVSNLFDYTTVTDNTYVDMSGVLITANDWTISDYIPVKKGDRLEFADVGVLFLYGAYNDAKQYISTKESVNNASVESGLVEIIEKNIAFIRVNVKKTKIAPSSYYVNKKYSPVKNENKTELGEFGLISYDNEPIDFDFVNSRIVITPNTDFIWRKESISLATSGTGTVNIAMDISKTGCLFYDKRLGQLKTVGQDELATITEDYILIATYNLSKANIPGAYRINGSLVSGTDGTNSQTSNWQGLKANFTGDSITYGFGLADPTAEAYPILVGNKLQMNLVRNYGINSRTICDNGQAYENPIVLEYTEMDDDADLIYVAAGTNDWGHSPSSPLGLISDRINTTFYGALHNLCNGLINKYPDKYIVFATPIHRSEEINTNDDGKYLYEYVDAIKEVCGFYGIPVIDMYSVSGIYPQNNIQKTLLVPDGLHPNSLGHQKIAERVAGKLNSIK